jgi:hydroxymethylglutaryl-CoA lyase
MDNKLKIIECPRDAMQGMEEFIPTDKKLSYLNKLLEVGFDSLDFGSFVSPKAVPQLKDTTEVVGQLNKSSTKLLAIVANLRGAEDALAFDNVNYLGYPMSVSETFQKKNANKSIVESLEDLAQISELCQASKKELVVYISMGFGNPYGDPYSIDFVNQFSDILVSIGASVISLSDTVGLANPDEVSQLFRSVSKVSDKVEWGVHLHAEPIGAKEKVRAALNAGCRRIDGAVLGYGGCPMAENDLVGNINTRTIIEVASELGLNSGVDEVKYNEAELMASTIF